MPMLGIPRLMAIRFRQGIVAAAQAALDLGDPADGHR